MSSKNMYIEDYTNISSLSPNNTNTSNKKYKIKRNTVLPSKPNYLKKSKISSLLHSMNEASLFQKNFHKKSKTIMNSIDSSSSLYNKSLYNNKNNYFFGNLFNLSNISDYSQLTSRIGNRSVDKSIKKIGEISCIKNSKKKKMKINKKVLYIYVKKNNSNSKIKNNQIKDNSNIKEFKTIKTTTTDRSKYKKIYNRLDKGKGNSFLNQININDLKAINDLIRRSSSNQKNNNKETLKSRITELSSLKKIMFENNNLKDLLFYKKENKIHKTENRNSINYLCNRIIKHKKTKTEIINNSSPKAYMNFSHKKKHSLNFKNNRLYSKVVSDKCYTDGSKLIEYMNTNNKNKIYKSKASSRNFKMNNSNYMADSSSMTYENFKTNYISPKQLEEGNKKENEKMKEINNAPFVCDKIMKFNSSLENISPNDNNYKQLLKIKNKENIFYKKKLIDKIKNGKISQSKMPFLKNNNINKNINKLNDKKLNLTIREKKEKLLLNIKTEKKLKKVIKIDSCTVPGYTSPGYQKINQDNYFVQKDFLNQKEHFIIGVSDGHGSYGHQISKYVCDMLPKKIKNLSEDNIKESFILTNNSLIKNSKIDCSLSGASCSIIIITPEKLISSNLGITKAVIARYEKGQYNTINLAKEHNLYDSNEMKRVLNNGGRIKENKIYIKNSEIPGLNITRSFGDNIAHSIGVSDVPYTKEFYFNGNEKFIILASDGIWKFIDSDESVRIIKDYYENGMDAVGALNALVREAFDRWKTQENIIDDITAVLLFFD